MCVGCERIANTPIPRAYSIHLEQMIWIYCLTFPFMILERFGFWTVLISAVVYYVILGVYAIGGEIENPFGKDNNDLPLELYCEEIRDELLYFQNNKKVII